VKALDDASNFDDYTSLPPMRHDKALSAAEKQLFADFYGIPGWFPDGYTACAFAFLKSSGVTSLLVVLGKP